MKRLMLLALVSTFLLGGCGGIHWYSPNYTPQQFARDEYECQRDTRVGGTGSVPMQRSGDVYGTASTNMLDASANLAAASQSRRLYVMCMQSKGYRQATAEERQAEERRAPGRVGITLQHRDTMLVIVGVTPGGPAERAGIVVGDRLVKVGGIPVDGQTKPEELSGMVTGAPGSKVLLTTVRDNQEKEITLIREVPSR